MISLRPSLSMAISRTCIMVAESIFLANSEKMFVVSWQNAKFASSSFFNHKQLPVFLICPEIGSNSISMVFLMDLFLMETPLLLFHHLRHLNLDRRTGFVKALAAESRCWFHRCFNVI